jgi:hypothetical protein
LCGYRGVDLLCRGGEMKQQYVYGWRNNEKRRELTNRRCTIVARLKMNSAIVRFENGQEEVISRNALRKATP